VIERVGVEPGDALADVDRGGLRQEGEVLDDDALARRDSGTWQQRTDREDERGDAERPTQTHTIARVSAVARREFRSLAARAAAVGVQLTSAQLAVCERYADELIERNTTVNLTAITELEAIAMKHFLDSFTACAVRVWTGRERVVDVGSGAGFPGLALRIAMPNLKLTCVESVGKKSRFLEETSALLGLRDVEVRNERAETLAHSADRRAAYDVGTARAVGTLAACAEYLLPFLRIGGDAIVWKGKVDAELPAARKALASVGGELASIVSTVQLGVADVLPGRNLVVMRKVRASPDRYPRASVEARRRPW
jgi:16S rRNA (guanine527-N7)-methyltransferase